MTPGQKALRTPWRRTVAIAIVAFLSGAAFITAAGLLREGRQPGVDEGWREIAWPFGRDAWPPGRAFRCLSSTCGGVDAEIYLRPKAGFCANCETGVTDDTEVDRVTDLDLISERFSPSETGEQVRLGDLPGRMRHYKLHMPGGGDRMATALAVSRQCDLVVAVVLWPAASGSAAQPEMSALLSSPHVTRMAASALSQRQ